MGGIVYGGLGGRDRFFFGLQVAGAERDAKQCNEMVKIIIDTSL